ncbi:MAG: fasciclin domain-containing protein [Desulfobacteraceae bacterium]
MMRPIRYAVLILIAIAMSLPSSALAGGYGHSKTASGNMEKADIVDKARSAGSFNTLVSALQAADLTETLKGEGPFTVFAPTDAAFEQLPAGTVADLLKPENKLKLQSILTYHVVPGKVVSSDAVNLTSAKTVNGQSFRISNSGSGLMVDDATVTTADIMASNGVIHVIDRVIMP